VSTVDYRIWREILGKTSKDEDVIAAFKEAGFSKPPRVSRSDFNAIEDIEGGMSVMLLDPHEYKHKEYNLPAGGGVLYSVSMWLAENDELYEGELPEGLVASDGRDAVRKKLGAPKSEDDDEQTDTWIVEDGLELEVRYTSDYLRLRHVSLATPLS
jgi:hypothetical protein